MKKIFFLLFILIQFFNLSFAKNFKIDSYDISLDVDKYSSVSVNEKFDVYFDYGPHYIIRKIPTINKVSIDKNNGRIRKTYAEISDVEVSEPFKKSFKDDFLNIEIGKADEPVRSENRHYEINYKYLFINSNKNLMYLNIIDKSWDTEIDKIHFKIKMPKEFPYEKVEFSPGDFNAIGFGEQLVAYNFDKTSNTITGHTTGPLPSEYGIKIKIPLPDNYFEKKPNIKKGTSVFIITFCLFISLFYWYIYGKDEKIIPVVNFYPPKNMNSAAVGMLYAEKAEIRHVISLIIYLADKGYLSVTDGGSWFRIHKIKEYNGEEYEIKMLMDALFPDGKIIVDYKDLKHSTIFYRRCEEIVNYLNETEKSLYEEDSMAFSTRMPVLIAIIALVVNMCFIFINFVNDKEDLFVLLCIPLFVAFDIYFCSLTFGQRSSVNAKITPLVASLFHGGIPLAIMIWLSYENIKLNPILSMYSVIAVIISVICFLNLPKKSKRALMLLGQIFGFRKFLQTTEVNKIKQLVKLNPKYCFDVLPYAYALNVTDEWVGKLDMTSIPKPEWYNGNFNSNNFNNITNSLMSVSVPTVENGGKSS